MKTFIVNFSDFMCQPCIMLPMFAVGMALLGVLIWAILFPTESEEFAKMLFGREKKTYKGKKYDNGYQKIIDDADVTEMMRLVKEAWK